MAYTATVTAYDGETPAPSASENFILAAHNTPFEVVGLAFINVSTDLASAATVYTGNIYTPLVAEQAGLTILAADAYPKQQIADLLKDVAKEIKLLDYVPSAPLLSPLPRPWAKSKASKPRWPLTLRTNPINGTDARPHGLVGAA